MCPNRRERARWPVASVLLGVLCLLTLHTGRAEAADVSVVVIPNDSSVAAVVAAMRTIVRDVPRDVHVKVVAYSRQTEDDLAAIRSARVFLLYNVGQELAGALAPQVAALRKAGGTAYVVGQYYTDTEKSSGFTEDKALVALATEGGVENWANVLRVAIARARGGRMPVPAPGRQLDEALWEPRSGRTFETWDAFAAEYVARRPAATGRRWVGLSVNSGQIANGQTKVVRAVVEALEARGFNVATSYGYPADGPIEHFYVGPDGASRVEAIVAMAMKFGNLPDRTVPLLMRLGVPVLNAVTLYSKTRAEWEASPLGLDLSERSWQISGPEFAGAVAPTIIASKEHYHDDVTGLDYIEETPMQDRVTLLAERVRGYVALRTTAPATKRVAIVYFNYPPGRENVGASYLNVLPQSLWQMLGRMEREGFDVRGRPTDEKALFDQVLDHGMNVGAENPGALDRLVHSGQVVLLPVSEYRGWLNTLPATLRDAMVAAWGEPEDSRIMIWRDARRVPYFVFPALRFGNVVLTPQPTRGWDQDIKKAYHDVTIPPHHQYLAFYLWLQKGFRAHAIVHVGTHGTMEWLSGKEIGQSAADPSEAMVGAVPQLYPYIVDVIGEGLQAKRRGMAALISHMTPPLDKAGLNPELQKLRALLDDYTVAAQKSESATAAVLADINASAMRQGLLKDLGRGPLLTAADVEEVEHYLKEVGEKQVPFGLHTFGVAPPEAMRRATAEAVFGNDGEGTDVEREANILAFMQTIEASARNELDAFANGLAGRYVAAGPGGDPIRRPDSLVTGRDLYGFDPSRLPTTGIWAQGLKLAEQLVVDYRKKHREYPDRLVFNLWSNETMRHEGVIEAEILALLGVRPKWDQRGKVQGVEVIARPELGRPRVDVTVVASGLYRDALPTLMELIDSAVSAVKDLDEPDNVVHAHVEAVRTQLVERGVAADEAKRLAAVRLFTEPSGAYGTGVEAVAMASNTWKNESEVADVYFNRVGHLFGQGYWGDRPGGASLAVDIFKMSLKGARAVIHARSSNIYGTLDNDDVYQYMGATAMAVRQVNGATPETLILNLADPRAATHESLDQFMGKEMRSRYLNPAWIDAMLKEGYAGARLVMQVTDNLWGWQVTVPEAVDGAKWQEMYETYVKDRNNLGIQQRFRDAGNLRAYQGMVDRMLVAVNKGYWKADASVVADLNAVNDAVMREAGVACDSNSCSSDQVSAFARRLDERAALVAARMPAPNVAAMVARGTMSGAPPAQAAPPAAPAQGSAPHAADNPVVSGKQITEVIREAVPPAPPLDQVWLPALVAACLVLLGYLVGGRFDGSTPGAA